MRFKPDLNNQLVFLSALTLLIWSLWPVKINPKMTYDMLRGTLSLYTTAIVTKVPL